MDGTCEDLTGRCYCRPNFTGEQCDACAEGFVGFPQCYREDAARWGGAGRWARQPGPHAGVAPSALGSFSHNDTGEQVLPAGQIVSKFLGALPVMHLLRRGQGT